MLDEYVHIFSKLNTDKNRKRWSEVTCHQAPHKPFLLLSVMDLIAQGVIYENFIEPTYELVDTFNVYWS
ncbi:MAG: HNH endonuclease, partial [Desulfobacterales bacterium]|nr:HNH endonuclease [Desulfobacterales bacterium]